MRHQALTQEQLDQAAALYDQGLPLVTIVKELRVPRETVRRGLIDAGVTMRKRGRPAGDTHCVDMGQVLHKDVTLIQ
jgi:orotate phosphoribosyltransferase-like protein